MQSNDILKENNELKLKIIKLESTLIERQEEYIDTYKRLKNNIDNLTNDNNNLQLNIKNINLYNNYNSDNYSNNTSDSDNSIDIKYNLDNEYFDKNDNCAGFENKNYFNALLSIK
tara:strand:- start:1581 stop:1925 length:345 start_codon:yes stop_codon:yes gene_type:complete